MANSKKKEINQDLIKKGKTVKDSKTEKKTVSPNKKQNINKPVDSKKINKPADKTAERNTKEILRPEVAKIPTIKESAVKPKKKIEKTTEENKIIEKKSQKSKLETEKVIPVKVVKEKTISVPKKEIADKEPTLATFSKEKGKAETNFGSFESIVIMILVALFACVIVYIIDDKFNNKEENEYSTASKEIQTFIEQYNNILENYYGDVDKNALIENAIKGMLTSLDGYSEFIDDGSNSFSIKLQGSYEGIGIEIANDSEGNIVVVNVYADTPAAKAGIQVGDYITKFNDEKLENIKTSLLVEKIAGVSKMNLTLLRNSEEKQVTVTREKITLKSVAYQMLDNKVGYIQISIFANNTYDQMKDALEALEKQGMEKLVLDVRNNSGGYLDIVKSMLSLFMDKSHIIYQTESKTETIKIHSTGKKDVTYPIVVLQNQSSASASEILASSLQEQLKAYIIGTTSFGKGTVQQLQNVSGVGQYKFTTKKWLTSNGTWINQAGVKPDLEVQLSNEYYQNPTTENDNQLQAALEYLK